MDEFGNPIPGPSNEFGYPIPGPSNEFGNPIPGPSNEFSYPIPGPSNEFGYPIPGPSNEFGNPIPGPSNEFGNPIPGPSNEFESNYVESTTVNYDFAWLQDEFDNNDTSEDVKVAPLLDSNNTYLNSNEKIVEIESCPNIEDFFEVIKCIDFSQNECVEGNNDTSSELLEQCNNFIDIMSRNVIYLENLMMAIKKNIEISKRNAIKAHKCMEFEKLCMLKTPMQKLKLKANLANFFKIGLSNCPQNPHLFELYETGRLILAYNGRFILEECIEGNLWNQDFKNKLEQAIHAEVLGKLKRPLLNQLSQLYKNQDLKEDPHNKDEISVIERELAILSKTPFQHLVHQFTESDTQYDWLHIAKIIDKPDLQCRRFWNLMLKPHVSRAKWTKQENDKLIQIVQKYGEKNWHQIAFELDSNRNELQCFVHYQNCKKMLNKKGKWSLQEDQKLTEIIKENSINNIINWQKVYFSMCREGRTVDQVYNRWMCSLKPGIKKGFLNKKEKGIIDMAQKRNMPPSIVSMNLTNRTPAQVRNAYRRIMSYEQDTYRGGWLAEEDKMLLQAVNPYAPHELSWSQVAKKVPGRNAEQCRHRFKLIEKKIQENPKLTVESIPRSKRSYKGKEEEIFPVQEHLDENILIKNFKENRELIKMSELIETEADRKLKKSFLDNIYVTNHCNFSSKCDLLKYVLDYLGADIILPNQFTHTNDLLDEGLMVMMTYLKEHSNKVLTLEANIEEPCLTDVKFVYEGIHDVLRTSDIINSDMSEVNGLFDIRMRNFITTDSVSFKNQNSYLKTKKTGPPLLCTLSSVPPNFETFRMFYTYMNNLTTYLKTDSMNNVVFKFNWDNEESKKLHQRLVAIFRWPALFSGTVDFNAAKINLILNTEQSIEANHTETKLFCAKNMKPNFNLKKFS